MAEYGCVASSIYLFIVRKQLTVCSCKIFNFAKFYFTPQS